MPVSSGPNTVSDSIIFDYDTGDIVNSYIGQPTTNLVPDAPNNGRFTLNNSWATYNTNQYCGNNGCGTYWTIPAIASVSSNIITTVSAHQIRTFDVIQPNATGGGVTAGTNYFAKKISDTQFSLHAYNSSQDGSQGYINPATGYPKVWDSILLDQRISVNASSFPTGWWGAPHLPNSGLVKEIVANGGRVPGTSCMRFNVWRGDGVADGMAYGVYTPVTVGDVITVSFYARAATPNAVGKGGYYTTYFGGAGAFSSGWNTGAYGEWVRNVFTWTASVSFNFYSYFFPDGSADRYSMDIADFQVEVNKGHATQFTTGTRSATQGLLDLSGKTNSIDLTNMSYDSNAVITFDGTSNYITIPSSPSWAIGSNGAVEAIIYRAGAVTTNHRIWCITNNSSNLDAYIDSSTGGLYLHGSNVGTNAQIPLNQYLHVVVTYNDGIVNIYYNGVSQTLTGTTSGYNISGTGTLYIGEYSGGGGYYFNGKIPIVKMYNRGLTATEVKQNYLAYKSRFNLA